MHPAINGPTTAEPTVVSITSSNNSSSQSVSVSGRQRSSSSQAAQPQPLIQQQQQYSGGSVQLPLENGIDFRHARGENAGQPIVR